MGAFFEEKILGTQPATLDRSTKEPTCVERPERQVIAARIGLFATCTVPATSLGFEVVVEQMMVENAQALPSTC
jgi:hypothetical protein